MAFATRTDLLARSNARRLAQLAVPADVAMPPEAALRVAIAGGDLTPFTPAEQASLTLALDAIDKALGDANELIVSYGIPATAASPLIARLCSTVALYYLQGAERMTDDVSKAYEASIGTLKAHAKGEISLLPVAATLPPEVDDPVQIVSEVRRYRNPVLGSDW
jgi:phage gp36-like protein